MSVVPPSPPSPPREPAWRKLADNRYAVIALIFCVTGCLGIPAILMCRSFTPPHKVFWVIISILYTAFLFFLLGVLYYYVWTYSIAPAIYGG